MIPELARPSAAPAGADVATVNDWPSYGGTHAVCVIAPEQINALNVSTHTVWVFQTGDYENAVGAPLSSTASSTSTSNAWVFASMAPAVVSFGSIT
jgi:hypothetical protein